MRNASSSWSFLMTLCTCNAARSVATSSITNHSSSNATVYGCYCVMFHVHDWKAHVAGQLRASILWDDSLSPRLSREVVECSVQATVAPGHLHVLWCRNRSMQHNHAKAPCRSMIPADEKFRDSTKSSYCRRLDSIKGLKQLWDGPAKNTWYRTSRSRKDLEPGR